MSARVADIACIAQATLKRIHHALLTHKRRFVFPDLNFILDLFTCINWANICVDLPTDRAPVAQLVEHWAVTREVVSSTPAGPTLRVFK